MNATTPATKTRKVAGQVDVFEVLLDGEVVAEITKTTRNVASKSGHTRTGYKMKTAWSYLIKPGLVSRGGFGTVNTKADAVHVIVQAVLGAR